MKIYVEVAIIDNLVINFLLLYLTGKFYKLSFSKLRLFLASLIGTAFALIFPLLRVGVFVLFCLKTLLGLVLVYVAFSPKKVKELTAEFASFILLTFLLGGLILAVFATLGISGDNFVLLSSSSIFPVSVFIVSVFVFFKLVIKFCGFLFSHAKIMKNVYKVKISNAGKCFEFKGFFDSGNLLKDESSGLPVCVISEKVFKKLCSGASSLDLILKKRVGLLDEHYVSFATVSNAKKSMLIFRPQKVEVFCGDKWEEKNVMLGICAFGLEKGNFDLLLNGFCEV